jgi:hypothetical protein
MSANISSRFEWDGDRNSILLPDGLSFEDIQVATDIVDEWLDSHEPPIRMVIEVFSFLARCKSDRLQRRD